MRINWIPAEKVAPDAAATGEAAGEDPEDQDAIRAEKPLMVYITAEDPTSKDVRKLEDVVFRNERLGIGAKFFKCIRITPAHAMQDRLLKDAGRFTPRIVFLRRDYEIHEVHERSKLSAGKLLRSMERVVRREYENRFDRMIREYGKLLNERDRLESKKSQLADARARLQESPNPYKAKKLERDEREWQEEMDAWTAKEKELLTLRTKGDSEARA